MDRNTKALKSGFWYFLSNSLIRSISLITTPIFARLMTHEEYGAYSNYSSWTNIAITFITMRSEASFISAKFDFRDDLEKYNRSLIYLTACIATVWILVVNLFPETFSSLFNTKRNYINLMIIYCFFHAVINIFQINERYKYLYKTSVFIAVLSSLSTTIVSIIFVVSMKNKLEGRILGHILPAVIIACILLKSFFKNGKGIDLKMWPYALMICIPYIPHLLSLQVLNSIDRIMITKICGPAENALYTIAYSCGHMVTLLMTSMNTAFAPWLGDKLHENAAKEIKRVSRYYIIIFSTLAIGMMLLAPEILLIMGGKSYVKAKYVMPPVSMGCICQFLYTLYVNVEQYKKKTIKMAIASISAALLNYVLNAYFIPRYGYIAAAYTTLAGYIFLLILHMIIVYSIGESKVFDNKFIILSTFVMFLITLGINYLYFHQVLRYVFIVLLIITICMIMYIKKTMTLKLLKETFL